MKFSSQRICVHVDVRSTCILLVLRHISSYSKRTAIQIRPLSSSVSCCPCCQWVYPDCTTYLPWKLNHKNLKFNPRKFSAIQLIVIPLKVWLTKKRKQKICYTVHHTYDTGSMPMICDMIKWITKMSLFHGWLLHEKEFHCKHIPLNEDTLPFGPYQDTFFAGGFHCTT